MPLAIDDEPSHAALLASRPAGAVRRSVYGVKPVLPSDVQVWPSSTDRSLPLGPTIRKACSICAIEIRHYGDSASSGKRFDRVNLVATYCNQAIDHWMHPSAHFSR